MTERTESPFWSYEDLALLLSALLPCYFGAYMLVRVSGTTSKEGQTLIFQASLFALLLGALYLLVSWRYRKPFWQSMGWVRPVRGAWWSVVGGPLLAVTVSVLGVALRAPEVPDPVKDLITGRLSLVTVMAFAVVFGPIYEELFFRGFLFPLLAKTFGAVGGIVLSAVPFALLHGPQNQWAWQQVTMVGVAGLAFGFVRHRTGSTAASTILHASFNLTQFVAFLALRGH
jgi:membrane protease YdiL (CAAX protease family)